MELTSAGGKRQKLMKVDTQCGEGNGNPLQCSCLENPRDRGAWWAAVYGVAQSWTWLKRLSSSSSSSRYTMCLMVLDAVEINKVHFKSLSRVWLFMTPWTVAHQTSLSITNSWSLLKLMSIELVMPFNHLILCQPLLFPPSIFPSISVLFKWVSSSHQVAKLEFQLQHQSFQWIFRTDLVGSC